MLSHCGHLGPHWAGCPEMPRSCFSAHSSGVLSRRPRRARQRILGWGPPQPLLVACTLRKHTGWVGCPTGLAREGADLGACSGSSKHTSGADSCPPSPGPAPNPRLWPLRPPCPGPSHPPPAQERWPGVLLHQDPPWCGEGAPSRPLTSTSSWPHASWGSSGLAAGPAAPGTWPPSACPGSSCSTRGRRT